MLLCSTLRSAVNSDLYIKGSDRLAPSDGCPPQCWADWGTTAALLGSPLKKESSQCSGSASVQESSLREGEEFTLAWHFSSTFLSFAKNPSAPKCFQSCFRNVAAMHLEETYKWLGSIGKSHCSVSRWKAINCNLTENPEGCCCAAGPKCRLGVFATAGPGDHPTSLLADILPCNWQLPHPSTHSAFLSLWSVNNSFSGCSPVRWIMGGEQNTRAHHRAPVVSQDSVSEGRIRFLHSARIRTFLFAGRIISPPPLPPPAIYKLILSSHASWKMIFSTILWSSTLVLPRRTRKVSKFLTLLLFQISRCLKPGGRFISITFVSPLLRKRLYARREYDWSIRKYSYGEGFEYFVYVMTKGEALGPEDAALQEKRPQDHKPSNLFEHSETAEEFLCSIHLWQIWITLVESLKVFTHWEKGETMWINDAERQMFCQQFFLYTPNATRICI